MRAFVALELPEGLAHDVGAMARRVGASCDCRPTPQQNLHLTLAFLGEVGEAGASLAVDALEEACAGVGPVALVPRELGSFGRGRDRTLWLGFEATPELEGLAARLRAGLDARGLDFDRKAFVPHVTLARRARLVEGALDGLEFPLAEDARLVTLYRSYLGRDGARYKPLHTVELGA